jgi:hypothetical protein
MIPLACAASSAAAIGHGKFLGTFRENLNPAVAPVAPAFDIRDQDIRGRWLPRMIS